MKKITYLLAFVTLAFTACQKEPALHSVMPTEKKALTLTLQASDYAELPSSNYAHSALSFKNSADAQSGIATILNNEYGNLDNGSTATVTYTQSAASFAVADSVIADDSYTLTNSDYTLLPGNKYNDFSVAQLLQWLPYKFPSPANNSLKLITWNIYPSSTSPVMPYSFLYTDGAWREIYTIQPSQYAAVGLGKYDEFTSSNAATLPQTLGALVNADVSITDTVKKGDIVYVSYNYYESSSADYQRVQPLVYTGSGFAAPTSTSVTINFIKSNGTWSYVQPLPVISHTLTTADIAIITSSTTTGASSSLLSNLSSYGDFESSWTPAELDAAFILVLQADYTAPATNTNYEVIFKSYQGGSDVNTTYTFQWSGTAWVPQQ
jgi:hypothetical protein